MNCIVENNLHLALIAQLVERAAVNRKVDGSKPSWSEKIGFLKKILFFITTTNYNTSPF